MMLRSWGIIGTQIRSNGIPKGNREGFLEEQALK